MKTFLRVAIVLIILVGLGFGAYAIFFKPANSDAVFMALADINNEEQVIDYDLMIKSIGSNYFNPTEESGFSKEVSDEYDKILKEYRGAITAGGTYTLGGATHYTYPELKTQLDTVFNYYFGYSQAVVKKVPKSKLNDIKDAVNSYEDSLTNLQTKFDSIEALQNKINKNKTENLSIELNSRYQVAVRAYRNFINEYTNLVEKTSDFVTEYVFDGENLTDRDSLLYDLMVKSLQSATNGDYVFDNAEQKAKIDNMMTDANKFINFAMNSDNNGDLGVYYYEGDTVTSDNKVYKRIDSLYLIPKIEIEIGNEKLYFSGTDIEPVGNITKTSDTEIEFLEQFTYTASDINGKQIVTIKNLIYNADTNTFTLYKRFDVGSLQWTTLINDSIVLGANSITFKAGTSSYSVDCQKFNVFQFNININDAFFYNIKENKVVAYDCDTAKDTVQLSDIERVGAVYNSVDGFTKKVISGDGVKTLSYDGMIEAYKEILKVDASQIDKMMELSLEDKIKFVKGDSTISSQFSQPLQYQLRYILASYGFM